MRVRLDLEHLDDWKSWRGLSGQEHAISPRDQKTDKAKKKKSPPVLPYSNSDMLCIPNAIRQYTCLSNDIKVK